MKYRLLEDGVIRVWEGNPSKEYAFAEAFVRDDNRLEILNIEVDAPLRRKGLGRKLIEKLKEVTGTRELVVNNIQLGSEDFWEKIK